ncbi:protein PPP4R3C-like [Acomys russatus]|uniref:protein PPP4R3C-like n=1 Tax=Acomys russatus TaxID=60746 RepID=UPI0021E24028|nr:protein PPP4R3C-like [Acomys russatus]
MDDTFRRVKVYIMMEDEQWVNIGSGQISSKYIERLEGVCLLVHSESDDSLIMEYKIHPNVPYQKQQGDLILWSEAKNHGIAIHFLEPNGCQEIWEDICQVQGKDPSVLVTQEITNNLESFEELPQMWNLVQMPNCELSTLENIADLIAFVKHAPRHRGRLALILENENYIKKLLQLFNTCENQKNIEGLHYLHNIIRGILFLNNTSLFKIMFSDECIMDVVGCLEYDPHLDQPKRHREFLTQNAKFKEVFPITHTKLRQKIHQTYRMQYIHDILLPTPSIFEKHLLSDLSTFIFFNKMEIITMLQEDEYFLFDVFAQLKDKTVSDERRCELLLFFKEFCTFAKTLHSYKKDSLLKMLIKLGIMSALKVVVHMHDCQIKVTALDIFTCLVEYNPRLVRLYAMEETQESINDDDLLINVMIEQMICDSDPEFSRDTSLTSVFRLLLDPENMRVTYNGCEKSEFLNFFYTHCMSNLIAPILSTTVQKHSNDNRTSICPDNYQNAQVRATVVELLTFCVQYHTSFIKNYILSNNLLTKVLVLMSSKHTFLILCAVRFMRKMIGLKDEIYNLYIIKKNLFEPVVNAFIRNGSRYNLLNSAIIELFEFIRVENIKSLIANIVEKFFIAFESVEYVYTFKGLKIKYEEEKERESKIRRNLHNIIYQKIYCRRIKLVEVKVREEMCSTENTEQQAILPMRSDFSSLYDMFMKIKEASENEIEHVKRKSSEAFECSSSHFDIFANEMSTSHCSSKISLVDYPDDDDGDNDDDLYSNNEKEDEDEEPPKKKPNLSS